MIDETKKKAHPSPPAAGPAGLCPTICQSSRMLRHWKWKLPSAITCSSVIGNGICIYTKWICRWFWTAKKESHKWKWNKLMVMQTKSKISFTLCKSVWRLFAQKLENICWRHVKCDINIYKNLATKLKQVVSSLQVPTDFAYCFRQTLERIFSKWLNRGSRAGAPTITWHYN